MGKVKQDYIIRMEQQYPDDWAFNPDAKCNKCGYSLGEHEELGLKCPEPEDCPLCGLPTDKPYPVHQACMDREAYMADR